MTDAGWAGEKPTKEGWYWWRNLSTDNAPEVWAIVDHGDGLEVVGPFDETCLDEWVADMKGEWLGPISPTDRQQGRVEGLREAAKVCRSNAGRPSGEQVEGCGNETDIAEAASSDTYRFLAGDIEKMAQAIEQQAQGGIQ